MEAKNQNLNTEQLTGTNEVRTVTDNASEVSLNELERLSAEILMRSCSEQGLNCSLEEAEAKLAHCKLHNLYPNFLNKTDRLTVGETNGKPPEPHTVSLKEEDQLLTLTVWLTWLRRGWGCSLDEVGAKVAFCKLLGRYPAFLNKTEPGGCDCRPCGLRISIKIDQPGQGAALRVSRDEVNEDVGTYVLMLGSFPVYRYQGRMAKECVCRPEYLAKQSVRETDVGEIAKQTDDKKEYAS